MKNKIKNYISESRNFLISSLIIYFLVSLAIIFYGRGGMLFTLMIVMLVFLLLLFFFTTGTAILLTALFMKNKEKLIHKSNNYFILTALVFGLIFPFQISDMIGNYDCGKAKLFCENITPALDDVKNKTGKYPPTIFVIVKKEDLPILLKRQRGFYRSDGNSFNFNIRNESSLMSGWIFSSEKRKWESWD